MEFSLTKKRLVVKIGTSTLTHESGHINIRRFEDLVKVLSDMQNAGVKIILVSSGAIAVGMGKIGLKEKPGNIPGIQACAAIGQCELMYLYDTLFGRYNHNVAQMLLTKDVVDDEVRLRHVKNTLDTLLEMNVIPIINENDTVAIDELVFGDNDTLSAMVAGIADAAGLVILSDIDGLYTANPRVDRSATFIPFVDLGVDQVDDIAQGVGTARGTGGMVTKIQAAKIAYESSIPMWIINGSNPKNLYQLLDGNHIGTYFEPKERN